MTIEWEGATHYSVCVTLALFFQLCATVMNSFVDSYTNVTAAYVDIVESIFHTIAVGFILYLMTIRASCAKMLTWTKYINYPLSILHFLLRLGTTIYSIMADCATIGGYTLGSDFAFSRQIIRMGMNCSALLVILYFETFITFYIRTQFTSDAKVVNRIHTYSFVLSFIITATFIAQVVCQAERLVYPTFIAPFQCLTWSLVLQRVIESKAEFKTIVSSKNQSVHTGHMTSILKSN
ncbi:hypothetical protein HK103_006983 [Boothiomyces macroporosus]|uniref:Uncharacterized protein n=1 Tax=Boothiomyces macroporosus TaxID=261099 RepID=A0AAD5UNR4_9FUNG|nr:hypothetical protein HK103_006983 [Boothiomyces macroporosus]